jgi:xylulokinase
VLEGLACAARDVAGRLDELGLPVREVVLLGGGARSALWAQIRADLLGVPHRVAAHTDATPIGAAMIAAVAAGIAPDLATLAALAPPPSATFTPDPAGVGPAAAAYGRYQRLVEQLAPLARSPWSAAPR